MCFMISEEGCPLVWGKPPWLVWEEAAIEFLVRFKIGLLWSELPESAFK